MGKRGQLGRRNVAFRLAGEPPDRIEVAMKNAAILVLSFASLAFTACSPGSQNPTPEQIRQDTAKATETAAKDAKAVVQGVEDGIKAKNINTATPDRLKTLPGIDDARANRIIANRPYDHADDLVKKHVVSQDEYDRIAGQVVAQ